MEFVRPIRERRVGYLNQIRVCEQEERGCGFGAISATLEIYIYSDLYLTWGQYNNSCS